MKKSKFTIQIEKKLKLAVPKKFKGQLTNDYFIKGKGTKAELCQLKFLNLTMPQVRAQLEPLILKDKISYPQAKALWFESDIFEARTLAGYWLDKQDLTLLLKKYKEILSWTKVIDNWAHADMLCSIYARMFEASPQKILPVYLNWNRHKNPWLRRCSMVGLFYYSRQRKQQPEYDLASRLVTPHFSASEYYVQKAVGWTIREMYNVYPSETIRFIDDNVRNIKSAAWFAASEKLPVDIKQKLLKKRRLNSFELQRLS